MNFGRTLNQVLAAIAATPILIGGLTATGAQAKQLKPLHAGQFAWAYVTLSRGERIITASTLLSLGDVDLELYDSSNRLVAVAKELGDERMAITVYRAGTFKLKYSMPLCINPFGACPVDINVY